MLISTTRWTVSSRNIPNRPKKIMRLEGKLRNQEFTAKAPPEIITDHQHRLKSLRQDHVMLASSELQLRTMLGT